MTSFRHCEEKNDFTNDNKYTNEHARYIYPDNTRMHTLIWTNVLSASHVAQGTCTIRLCVEVCIAQRHLYAVDVEQRQTEVGGVDPVLALGAVLARQAALQIHPVEGARVAGRAVV